MAKYDYVYRFLSEDVDQIGRFLHADEQDLDEPAPEHRAADRADQAEASPLEHAFEEHFANVYGADSARYLTREYAVTDLEGHSRYIDYLVHTRDGMLGVEENGVRYHHPQLIGRARYRKQLLKQNTCQHAGIKLFRFSTEDCRFSERFEDDIRSYFGSTTEAFVGSGMVVRRDVSLYEHQVGALEEMARRRAEGVRCFLAVFPTASGKSRIVEEDLLRFASTCPGFKALITAPNTAIVDDWKARLHRSLPAYERDILVCTYGYINRHYTEFAPEYFSYIVIDEAHHAVAPALKRTIQYFDPAFLVGLTATDERPDRKRLESVFGTYRTRLSLAQAMERGIVARANVYRIETNLDLSHVRINGRDYVNADLEKTVRVSSRNELIVQVLREYFCEGEWGRRQGVIFCVNVAHAKEMERLLVEAGIPARALHGGMRGSERVLQDFRVAERYEGYLSVEQLARAYFVNTGTINSWIRKSRIEPSVSFPFVSRKVHLFSPADAEAARVRLGIPVHSDETIRDDFLAFLAERDYSLSYKMTFLLAFLDRMERATGNARIDEVLDDYIAFYRDRVERGLVVDRASCPYDATTLENRGVVKRSMLMKPVREVRAQAVHVLLARAH